MKVLGNMSVFLVSCVAQSAILLLMFWQYSKMTDGEILLSYSNNGREVVVDAAAISSMVLAQKPVDPTAKKGKDEKEEKPVFELTLKADGSTFVESFQTKDAALLRAQQLVPYLRKR